MRHIGNQSNDVTARHSEASNLIRSRRHPRYCPHGWTQAESLLEHSPGVRQCKEIAELRRSPAQGKIYFCHHAGPCLRVALEEADRHVIVVADVSKPASSSVMTSSRSRRGLMWFSSAS